MNITLAPKIRNTMCGTVLAAVVAAVPLKSSAPKISHGMAKSHQKITNVIDMFEKTQKNNENFLDFMSKVKPKQTHEDSLRQLPISMPRPSLNIDVSKTRFQGNPKFLELFLKGVLKGKGQAFYNAQEKYGVNASFLIGIANHESGYGKSSVARRCNNIGEMRTGKGYIKYKSVEECIDSIASNLSRNYIKRGLRTLPQIGKKYCETSTWPNMILAQMKNIHDASHCMVYKFD